jgi:hypothetical protein
MTIISYGQRLIYLSDLLTNVDAPVKDQTLVLKMLNALPMIYGSIIIIIQHYVPFMLLLQASSMFLRRN